MSTGPAGPELFYVVIGAGCSDRSQLEAAILDLATANMRLEDADYTAINKQEAIGVTEAVIRGLRGYRKMFPHLYVFEVYVRGPDGTTYLRQESLEAPLSVSHSRQNLTARGTSVVCRDATFLRGVRQDKKEK